MNELSVKYSNFGQYYLTLQVVMCSIIFQLNTDQTCRIDFLSIILIDLQKMHPDIVNK